MGIDLERVDSFGYFSVLKNPALLFFRQCAAELSAVPLIGFLCGVLVWFAAPLEFAPFAWFFLLLSPILIWHRWLGLFLLGLGVSSLHGLFASAPVSISEEALTISGYVVEIGHTDSPRMILRQAEGDSTYYGAVRVRLRQHKTKNPSDLGTPVHTSEIVPGDIVAVRVLLFPLDPAIYPGAQDKIWQSQFRPPLYSGISLSNVVRLATADEAGIQPPTVRTEIVIAWQRLRARIRADLLVALARHVPPTEVQPSGIHSPEVTKNLMLALAIGERSGLDEETWRVIRQSGIAHLLAISGLHVSLVASAIFLGLFYVVTLLAPYSMLRKRSRARIIYTVLVVIFVYMLVVGASISSARATLMATAFLTAMLIRRRAFSFSNVLFAACLLLAINPTNLLDIGFQLSFAAVGSIVAVTTMLGESQWLRQRISHAPWAIRFVISLVGISFLVGIATTPIVFYTFGEVSRFSMITNLLAVPLTTLLILPLCLVYVLTLPFEGGVWLQQLIWDSCNWLLKLLLDIASSIASLPHNLALHHQPPVAIMFGGLVALLLLGTLRRQRRLLVLLPVAYCGYLLTLPPAYDILIAAERSRKIAIRTEEGYNLYAARTKGFVVDRWRSKIGIPAWVKQPNNCAHGCVIKVQRRKNAFGFGDSEQAAIVVIADDLYHIRDFCRYADLVITPFAPPANCAAPTISLEDIGSGGFAFASFAPNATTIRIHHPTAHGINQETFRNIP